MRDLLEVIVRRNDLYAGHGVSGGRGSRPAFDKAIAAVEDGGTLVFTTLDRLGRSAQNMLAFAEALRGRGAGLRVLNLGGGRRHTFTDSQTRNAVRLLDSGEPATQVARDLGMSRATLYRRIRELPPGAG